MVRTVSCVLYQTHQSWYDCGSVHAVSGELHKCLKDYREFEQSREVYPTLYQSNDYSSKYRVMKACTLFRAKSHW